MLFLRFQVPQLICLLISTFQSFPMFAVCIMSRSFSWKNGRNWEKYVYSAILRQKLLFDNFDIHPLAETSGLSSHCVWQKYINYGSYVSGPHHLGEQVAMFYLVWHIVRNMVCNPIGLGPNSSSATSKLCAPGQVSKPL